MDVKLTTYLQLAPSSRNADLCIHSHMRLHGALLSYLSTGKILLLPYAASYTTGTGILSQGVQRQEREAYQCQGREKWS